MADWVVWFGVAGVLVILEMFTGTFYLLMVGIGFAAGGTAALAGAGLAVQLAVAAIAGSSATYGLRRSRWGRNRKKVAARDPDVNLDIGQTLVVDAWKGREGETPTARVSYRGAMWDVELDRGATARPGRYVIREIRGNRLVVADSMSNNQ